MYPNFRKLQNSRTRQTRIPTIRFLSVGDRGGVLDVDAALGVRVLWALIITYTISGVPY